MKTIYIRNIGKVVLWIKWDKEGWWLETKQGDKHYLTFAIKRVNLKKLWRRTLIVGGLNISVWGLLKKNG